MADYIFNIPGTGCTDKQIGSCSCGEIASVSIAGDSWGVSVSSTTNAIYLTALENSDTTSGRSEDVTISYTIGSTTDSITATLCQANKHGDTPVPPVPPEFKLKLITNNGEFSVECDGNGQLTHATVTALTTDVTSIQSAEINGGENCITSITQDTFAGCINLTSVTINEGVETVHGFGYGTGTSYSTAACTSLREIYIPNSVKTITSMSRYGAFEGCTDLRSCTFGDKPSLLTIGSSSFEECTSLSDLNVPSGVTYFADGACSYCTGLTSLTVDSSNTTYDSRGGCNAIMKTSDNVLVQGCVNTTIPSDTTSIGTRAFNGMSNITAITIPDSVTSIKDWGFNNCSGLKKVNSNTNGVCNIPSNVTSIGKYAFSNCSGFTSVIIPNSVTNIGDSAFNALKVLTSVTIGNSVTTIGEFAFFICTSLTSIKIPSSITNIGNSAFGGCSNLTSITIEATTPPALGTESVFPAAATIYVPSTSVNTYKSTWSQYSDKIQAIP